MFLRPTLPLCLVSERPWEPLLHDGQRDNLLNESIAEYWLQIDPELLLVAFLPGLVMSDALSLDLTLFHAAFWQCVVFAVPVLSAVAALIASCLTYLSPTENNWTFSYSLVFGAILAANDHAAISDLLASIGAPPRLKIHLAGEALFNDAVAYIVFWIALQHYLADNVPPEYSRYFTAFVLDYTFQLVFLKTIGSLASGLLFGLGNIFVLWLLKRRLSHEEITVQALSTLVSAYLSYYVTEVIWGGSGVVATLTLGLLVNAHGLCLISDLQMLRHLWGLVEHVLMTVLLTLGGLVFGNVVANEVTPFTGHQWGYLLLLYLAVNVIRFLVFFAFYPFTVRIGLGTNWKETTFQAFAGIRGTIGIALALYVHKSVMNKSELIKDESWLKVMTDVSTMFAMVSGIAFLTITLNGSLANPVAKALGLAESSEIRRKMFDVIHRRIQNRLVDSMVSLLSDVRFQKIDFSIVQHHVPMTRHTSITQLNEALTRVESSNRQKRTCQARASDPIRRLHVVDGVDNEHNSSKGIDATTAVDESVHIPVEIAKPTLIKEPAIHNDMNDWSDAELRKLYVDLLRGAYARQIASGELTDRQGMLHVIEKSLQLAEESALNGEALNDWHFMSIGGGNWYDVYGLIKKMRAMLVSLNLWKLQEYERGDFLQQRYEIEKCTAFLEAQRVTRELFQNEYLQHGTEVTERPQVLSEAARECTAAESVLSSFPERTVTVVVSHCFSKMLLTKTVGYIHEFANAGLLLGPEVERLMEEIEEQFHGIESCDGRDCKIDDTHESDCESNIQEGLTA